ncbi:hypothetical protein T492DRAFT_975492 [Pavlovales sp. CCMP2436]|nr:hypothetical protein T492DRAFT_975492 [Pavlovales sp. CCMP2436]|mmetsp:Transcript_14842/g.37540  ORF Transcript_14842/g.37540 Transcript_14842/m.37540 type:complete len:267 (-) Transcript_14842:242-1042(-)
MPWPFELVFAGFAASYASYFLARGVINQLYPAVSAEQRQVAAHAVACLAHNVIVSAMAVSMTPWRALLLDGEPLWHARVEGFDVPAAMSAGFFVFDLILSHLWVPFSWLMIAHHVLSFACWTCSVWVAFAQPWIAYCLATEISSIFLSTRTLVGALGDKKGSAYAQVTGAFGASFILVRTLPIPLLARTWLNSPPFGVVCGTSRVARSMGWMSLLPLLLNTVWSVQLIRKAAREGMTEPRPSESQGKVGARQSGLANGGFDAKRKS